MQQLQVSIRTLISTMAVPPHFLGMHFSSRSFWDASLRSPTVESTRVARSRVLSTPLKSLLRVAKSRRHDTPGRCSRNRRT